MKTSNITVYIEQDEDGIFIGSVPSISSCYAQGDTQEELMANLSDVVRLCLRNQEDSEDIKKTRFVGIQNLDLSHA